MIPQKERRYRGSSYWAHNKPWRVWGHDPHTRIMINSPSLSPSVEAALPGREPSQAKRATCENRRGWKSRVRRASAVQCVPEISDAAKQYISKPCPHEDAVFVVFKYRLGAYIMKKDKLPVHPGQSGQESQVLYIDGCKVSVKYSDQKNPAAVQNIKDILISSGSIKRSWFFAFFVGIWDNNSIDGTLKIEFFGRHIYEFSQERK